MIDFSKLLNRTPEEKARDQAELDAKYEAMEAARLALIEKRRTVVLALEINIVAIPEKDHRFIRDMSYRATTYDMGGILGDRLGDLSEKQAQYLDGLAKRYLAVGSEPAPVTEPGIRNGERDGLQDMV